MDVDDSIRTRFGVVACLRDMGNGTSRLFIDDVEGNRTENPIDWAHKWFVTFTPEMQNDAIEKMDIDDELLRTIGAAVLARCFIHNDPTD